MKVNGKRAIIGILIVCVSAALFGLVMNLINADDLTIGLWGGALMASFVWWLSPWIFEK